MAMLRNRLFPLILILCGLFASSSFVWADDPAPVAAAVAAPVATPAVSAPVSSSFESAFQAGLNAYQKQDYAAAQTAFQQALGFRPDENSTLFNLALTSSRLGQKGWAL